MTTSIQIRRATPEDAEALAALNAHVQDIHVRHHPAHFRSPDPSDVADWFRARLAEPGIDAWLVVVAGQPVAYALVIPRERPATPFTVAERSCEIDQLGVLPAARRQGIARALAEHIRSEAMRTGITALVLNTWTFDVEARPAFEQLGFRPEQLRYRFGE